jgi:hypothetical protein
MKSSGKQKCDFYPKRRSTFNVLHCVISPEYGTLHNHRCENLKSYINVTEFGKELDVLRFLLVRSRVQVQARRMSNLIAATSTSVHVSASSLTNHPSALPYTVGHSKRCCQALCLCFVKCNNLGATNMRRSDIVNLWTPGLITEGNSDSPHRLMLMQRKNSI